MLNATYHLLPDQSQPELSIQVSVTQLTTQHWQLTYQLDDPRHQVHWPQPELVLERQDDLWESTCFELFIQAVGQSEYVELNFSPTRHWNAYRFDAYRQPTQMPPCWDERVRLNSLNIGRNTLVTVVDLSDCFVTGQALNLGISAVLQDHAGQCSYWALQHGGQPDFHRASDWLVQVDA